MSSKITNRGFDYLFTEQFWKERVQLYLETWKINFSQGDVVNWHNSIWTPETKALYNGYFTNFSPLFPQSLTWKMNSYLCSEH